MINNTTLLEEKPGAINANTASTCLYDSTGDTSIQLHCEKLSKSIRHNSKNVCHIDFAMVGSSNKYSVYYGFLEKRMC